MNLKKGGIMTSDSVFWEKTACFLLLCVLFIVIVPSLRSMFKQNKAERFKWLSEKIKKGNKNEKLRAANELVNVFLKDREYRHKAINLIAENMSQKVLDEALLAMYAILQEEEFVE